MSKSKHIALDLSTWCGCREHVLLPAWRTSRSAPTTFDTAARWTSKIRNGLDVAVLSMWLGHEKLESVNAYIQADLSLKERAIDLLSR